MNEEVEMDLRNYLLTPIIARLQGAGEDTCRHVEPLGNSVHDSMSLRYYHRAEYCLEDIDYTNAREMPNVNHIACP
jgi:hypothetical protein